MVTRKQKNYMREFSGKKVAVLGIGISNIPVIRFLIEAGAKVMACDKRERPQLKGISADLDRLPVEFKFGKDYLSELDGFDMIFPTPGMPLDLPELVKAREKGVLQSNEIGLFLDLCEAPVIGITGSDGKTTTTTLVGEILKAGGKKVFVGGNIGTPLLPEVFKITSDCIVVLELSSFQLQPLKKSPNISVVLNLSPNHLDHHRSMKEYGEAKENIFRHQRPGDYAILNRDNPGAYSMKSSCPEKLMLFSRHEKLQSGAYVKGQEIIVDIEGRTEAALSLGDIKLPGEHNIENILAVSVITALAGCDFMHLRNIIKEFTGVEHRIEFVAEKQGVRFYNDSGATTPSRAIAAIESFQAPIILIAGGSDKNLSFQGLGETIARRIKSTVLMGHTAEKIKDSIETAEGKYRRKIKIVVAEDLKEAVNAAFLEAAPGDVVLLSPACASFDLFSDYRARGRQFKKLVKDIE